jgi:hypothetical protein
MRQIGTIMRNTAHATTVRDELSGDELDAVTGGSFDLGNIVGSVIKATAVDAPAGPPDVWVGCAWVPQWW